MAVGVLVLVGWFVASVPTGLLVGQVLRSQTSALDRHTVSILIPDQREPS